MVDFNKDKINKEDLLQIRDIPKYPITFFNKLSQKSMQYIKDKREESS
jgi:hypothetical protein